MISKYKNPGFFKLLACTLWCISIINLFSFSCFEEKILPTLVFRAGSSYFT